MIKFIFRYFLTYNLKKHFILQTIANPLSLKLINTDNGTLVLSKKENGKTSTKINNRNNKITRIFVCKDVHIHGRLELIGKKVISIRSCYGDIIINSTHPVEVFCSDNGDRTSCVYANHSDPCNDSYKQGKFKRLFANIELL